MKTFKVTAWIRDGLDHVYPCHFYIEADNGDSAMEKCKSMTNGLHPEDYFSMSVEEDCEL